MPPEQEPAADSGALSLDQFVAVLDEQEKPPAPKDTPDEAQEPEPVDDSEAEEEPEATEEDEDEAEEEAEEEEEEEKLPPPQSWAKEDHAAWNDLPATAQAVIAKREADRDRAVAISAQKASEADKKVRTLAEDYESVAQTVTDDVSRAKAAWQRNWGDVDWVSHARANPDSYLVDKAQAEAEWQDIATYEAHAVKVRKDADDAAQLARTAFLKEEAEKLAAKMPELMDPKKGDARRQQLAAYLFESYPTITPQALSNASADELIIAEKARRYDESQKLAKSRAALPRKNPTNQAKPVPQSTASGASSPQRALQAANQRLTKTGSIDAFVDVLNLEEEQRTRKARRS